MHFTPPYESTPNRKPEASPLQEAKAKYKTEICKNWVQGTCSYREHCLFAHGNTEIRPRTNPLNYKTKFCVNILRGKMCPYGDKCQFIHEEKQLNTKNLYSEASRMLLYPDPFGYFTT